MRRPTPSVIRTLAPVPEPRALLPEAEPKPPPGRVVGSCRLTRALVEGRTGSVHRAVRGAEELSVRLLEGPAPDPAGLERLREESRRLARLGHPNLGAVSELGVADDGHLFAVLEPLSGTDLATILHAERRLEGARALEIAAQVARALGAAHGQGILHLRLEPERVIVGTPGDAVKVLDFALGPAGRAEAASIPYRAPEQLAGGAVDDRADVYGVAALLYELLTGAPPHAGSPDPAARKLADPVQSPRMFRPEMPIELERLLLSALEREPDKRPANMAAFEEGLLAAARGAGPISTGRPARPGAPDDRRRLRREAAFRVIGELLAPPPAPVTEPPPTSPPPAPEAPDQAPDFGGAMLDRYGAGREVRSGLSRKTYALAVLGSLGIAAALAWRLLR
jgi:serine/threonine-protein kinase